MDQTQRVPMVILSGNSHPVFARLVCERLDVPEASCVVKHASNKETLVEIRQTVRARDVYVIQTGTRNVNDDIMELLTVAYACKTSCARNIVGVIPYLPYCKQSKLRKRGSVVARLLADMMWKAGFNHIITMDLHSKEIQGFYGFPVDNLRASSYLIQYITEYVPDYKTAVIIAKNPGAVKRASSYAERMQLPLAVIHGEEKSAEHDTDDGRNSPPPVEHEESEYDSLPIRVTSLELNPIPVLTKKEKPPLHLVGSVSGNVAIIVDDLIDELETFAAAAEVLHEAGAVKVYVVATHGQLCNTALKLIKESYIDEVVVTNTIPLDNEKHECHKIKTVDVTALFAEAIRRIHNKESMSYLFRNIASND